MSNRHPPHGDDEPAYGDEGPAYGDEGPAYGDEGPAAVGEAAAFDEIAALDEAAAYGAEGAHYQGDGAIPVADAAAGAVYDYDADDAYGDETVYIHEDVAYGEEETTYWEDDVSAPEPPVATSAPVPPAPIASPRPARAYVEPLDEVSYGDQGPSSYAEASATYRVPHASAGPAQRAAGGPAAGPRAGTPTQAPPRKPKLPGNPNRPTAPPTPEVPPEQQAPKKKARARKSGRNRRLLLVGALLALGASAGGYFYFQAPPATGDAKPADVGFLATVSNKLGLTRPDSPGQVSLLEDDLLGVQGAIVAYVDANDALPKSAKSITEQLKKMDVRPSNPFIRLGGDCTLEDGDKPSAPGVLCYKLAGDHYELRAGDGQGQTLHINGSEFVIVGDLDTARQLASAAHDVAASGTAKVDPADKSDDASDDESKPKTHKHGDTEASDDATASGAKGAERKHAGKRTKGEDKADDNGEDADQGSEGKKHGGRTPHGRTGSAEAPPIVQEVAPSIWSPAGIWASIINAIPYLSPKDTPARLADLEDNLLMAKRAVDHYAAANGGSPPSSEKALQEELHLMGLEILNPYAKTTTITMGEVPTSPGAIAYVTSKDHYQLRIGDIQGKTLKLNGVDFVIDAVPDADAGGKEATHGDKHPSSDDDKGDTKQGDGKQDDTKQGEDDGRPHHKGLTDPSPSPSDDADADTGKGRKHHKRHRHGEEDSVQASPSPLFSDVPTFADVKRLRTKEFWNSDAPDPGLQPDVAASVEPTPVPLPPEPIEARFRHNHEFDLWRMRGISRMYSERPGAALEAFNKALAIRPGDPSVTKWVNAITQAMEKQEGENKSLQDRARNNDAALAQTRGDPGTGAHTRTGRPELAQQPPLTPPNPPVEPTVRTPSGHVLTVHGSGRSRTSAPTDGSGESIDDLRKADKVPTLAPPKLDP